MTIKTVQQYLTGLAFLLSSVAFGQPGVEKISVPLTDPSRPVMLEVGLVSGGIVVKGYTGKEVIIEASMTQQDEEGEKDKKAGKMKLIPNTSLGLTAEEEDNTVNVSTGLRGISHKIDLVISVRQPAR